MRRPILVALLVAHVFLPGIASANPVSFKDGYGIMPVYTPDWSDLELNYSFTNKDAFGTSAHYRNGEDSTTEFYFLRYNRLIKRWNALESQGNLYGSFGVGARHDSEDSEAPALYGQLEADYETRRIYTLIAAETMQSPDGVQFNRFRGRAGVAPYKASFTGFQTWVIAQVDYMPEMENAFVVTPLLRFFYHNYALETGVGSDGSILVAGMAHF